ncbi:glycosyltransferase family 61 protein [Fontibacillus sp. BL9]|uniref:glycosyltransferase family 61 protein n=1 Tax=Fontibacillus sp. BL9 TaxID=3389971 RepID=UPI00397BA008
MILLANGHPPKDYYRDISEWDLSAEREGTHGEYGEVIPFDFGGVAEFAAPKSIETYLHPDLTPYRLRTFGGYLAIIPGGKVWGSSGAILSSERKLIFDLSQEYDAKQYRMLEAEEHPVFHRWNEPELQDLNGTAAVLTFCGSYNYFHWLYDVLPRFAMLQASPVPYSAIIMNPNPYGPFVEQTWSMLGISGDMVIRASPELYIRPKRLVVPSLMMNSHYPPWATQTLRRLMLPFRDTGLTVPERIYISRSKADTRRIVNEDQVIRCLEEYGFASVCLEEYTVAEQIQLFAAAKAIVGPHGAGLANLAFCSPGTRIIELFHNEHIVPTYWMISNHNALDYYMLYGRGCPDPAIRFKGLEDIYVDTERLKRTLQLAEL